jgi:putative ABC transport system permease protein
MPADFQFPSRVELWVPAGQLSGGDWQQRANHPGLYGVARLKRGVTIEQARSDTAAIALGLEKQYPDTNRDHRITLTPLMETIVGDVGWTLWVLFAAASFVLLIACANVANLLLVRAAARQREMAIRAALGASHARLTRQLLTESVMMALLGGGAGWLALWGVKVLITGGSVIIPRASEVSLDGRVLAFAAGASVLTGILFGLAPAWQTRKVSLQQTLKEAGHSVTAVKQRMRSALIVTEIALALVLLAGAGLLLRSFYQLNKVDPGFSYDHLLSFSLSLPEKKYSKPQQRIDFFGNLARTLSALPGAQSVGLASGLPFGSSSWRNSFVVKGRPVPPPGEIPLLEGCLVTPDYFRTMGIPLRAGRYFTEQDSRLGAQASPPASSPQQPAAHDPSALNQGATQVAGVNAIIIDEEFARRYWPDEDAVGKRIRVGPVDPGTPLMTVVGVVGRVKMDRLSAESNRVQCYLPYLQFPYPFSNMTVVIKTALEPAQMIAVARQKVQSLDPNQPIYNLRTLEQVRAESIAPERLNLTLLSLFASLALILAAVGIYGVVSYSVTQRTHEIGIRLALGARRGDVLKLVVGQGMKLALVGAAIGLVASFALTRSLKSLLFGVSTNDPLTLTAIALLLTGVALLACFVPAWRATKVDPLVPLRQE